mmetsp:Transcript_29422/g.29029  ORF Transcript_29422/g.29029 Transcript_29422/m.29029 type:complete len:153 (-) Transcript_29422:13-471(-)
MMKQGKKTHDLSINWHDYAELRKSNLPNIFNTTRNESDSIKDLRITNKRKSVNHKSLTNLMPPILKRYNNSITGLDNSPTLHKNRSQPNITSSMTTKSKKPKNAPFTISLKPSGENYLNYLLVKEQQRMRNNRMQLLKTLDEQKHRFKFKHS